MSLRAAGVVLTGGASRRMGADKALLEVAGTPMALRVARVLAAAGCRPVWCQGGDAEALAALGLDARDDPAPGEGPVAAIAAALDAAVEAGADGVVVAACDLPRLERATVAELARQATPGRAATLAVRGAPQLVGWWPIGCRAELRELLAHGRRAYGAAIDQLGATLVDTAPEQLANVNTPDDLAAVASSAMAIPEVSVDELAGLLAGGARLIDVREPDEYAEARVPGAVLVPLGTVPDQLDAFRGDGTTYVICARGARSLTACEFAAEAGIDVANVAGGTLAWIDAGHPVDAG